MDHFKNSIIQVLKGAIKAFTDFPATIACALAFSIVALIRIYMGWPQQEAYAFLFNCLQWAFALGAIGGMASVTAAKSRFNDPVWIIAANVFALALAGASFFLLYQFGGSLDSVIRYNYKMMTSIAVGRMSAAVLVSFVSFIILASEPKEHTDFAKAFFMVHKAFFVALLYGLVLFGGTSGVASAVQALLYTNMSYKIYQYLGIVSLFVGFTIFVGYFPDFRQKGLDARREAAQQQPRFVEVLLSFILVPIVMALTVVLLVWSGKTVLTGVWPNLIELFSITTSYVVGGVWLYVMVTHIQTALPKTYRKLFPFCAIVILAFEAWALFVQIGRTGLKTTEYMFALLWLIGLLASVLLIIWENKAYRAIAIAICVLAILSVMPVIGYQALPTNLQIKRLEKALGENGLLVNERIVAAGTQLDEHTRFTITDAVNFLGYYGDEGLYPTWFEKRMADGMTFRSTFGFDPVWSEETIPPQQGHYLNTSLTMPLASLDIRDYQQVIFFQNEYKQGFNEVRITDESDVYLIRLSTSSGDGMLTVAIFLEDEVLRREDLKTYAERILALYPAGKSGSVNVAPEDLCLKLTSSKADFLLVFNHVDITVDTAQNAMTYWFDLSALYFRANR